MAGRKASARRARTAAIQKITEIRAAPAAFGHATPREVAGRSALAWPSRLSRPEFFRSAFPAAVAHAIQEADSILDGRLTLFGQSHRVAGPGGGIDWNYRPPAPGFEGFRDDPKFPWEVARHAILPRLGVAHWLTGESRYPRQAAALVTDWCASCPAGAGLHYQSALEVGIRLIAWCQAFYFFRRTPEFEPVVLPMLNEIAAMAAWLEGHLSTDRVVAGNHLLGELAGLIVTDLIFPELGEGRRLGRCLSLFDEALALQVAADGVSLEQSATYGRFVGDFVVAVLATCRAAGVKPPLALKARSRALAGWLAAMTRFDGRLPLIGDNDNGRGVDWGEPLSSDDARGVIFTLATLAGDSTVLSGLAASGPESPGGEVVFWWLGEAGVADFGRLLRQAPAAPALLRHYSCGGHAVIRREEDGGGDHVIVRCGPFGYGLPKPSAHSHADFMAPVVTLSGQEVLIDPGNFGYTTAGEWRDAFRVAAAHSTFTIRGHELAQPGSTFRWNDIPPPGVLERAEDEASVRLTGRFALASPKGTKRVAAMRSVRYNKVQHFIEIEDSWGDSTAIPPETVVWRWRLPRGARAECLPADAGFRVQLAGGAVVLLELDPVATVRVESGWIAPRYAERVPAPVAVVERPAGSGPRGRQLTRLRIAPSSGDQPA